VPEELYAGVEAAVDLSRLGLNYVRQEGDLIRMGALTPLQAMADSDLLNRVAGGIVAEAARFSAGSALRQAATLGGALNLRAREDPAQRADPPELALVFLVLDASLVYVGADGTRSRVSFDSAEGALGAGWHFLAEVNFANPDAQATCALVRIARTPRDQAILAAAASVERRGDAPGRLRLAVSGASDRTMRLPAVEDALAGQALTPEVLAGIDANTAASVDPRSDHLGGADYRREMAGVLARRAIEAALAQAA
jgi:carbon-monoxide dehydrogenase medium subunit